MNRIITGQIILILCCVVYLVWWYRGFRPGVSVSRVSGLNGLLLAVTAILGIVPDHRMDDAGDGGDQSA